MIWILLLYVLPLVVSILGLYYITKREEGTIKQFLEPLPYLFIPLFNIVVILAGAFFLIEEWIKEDDNWQDFLNKKL